MKTEFGQESSKYKPWSLKQLKHRIDTLFKAYCVWKQISQNEIKPDYLQEWLRSIAFFHSIFYKAVLQTGDGKQFYFQNWNIIHINLWRKLNHWECDNGGKTLYFKWITSCLSCI